MTSLKARRIDELLKAAQSARILVVGDVMLDQFLWGRVARISPEAPVPVVDFERDSFMPGGAAIEAFYKSIAAGKLSAAKVGKSWFTTLGEVRAWIERGSSRRSRPAPPDTPATSREVEAALAGAMARLRKQPNVQRPGKARKATR